MILLAHVDVYPVVRMRSLPAKPFILSSNRLCSLQLRSSDQMTSLAEESHRGRRGEVDSMLEGTSF